MHTTAGGRRTLIQPTGSVTIGTSRSLTVMDCLPLHSAPSIFRLVSCYSTESQA